MDLTGKEADLSDLKDFDSDGFEGTSSCTEVQELVQWRAFCHHQYSSTAVVCQVVLVGCML